MNTVHATYKRAMGGYLAMVRLDRDGFHKPVLDKGGKPKLFDSALSAQIAATDAVCTYFGGNYRRWGETLSGGRREAEKMFVKLKRRATA